MNANKNNTLYKTLHEVIGLHHCRSRQLLESQGVYPGQPPLLFALHTEDGQSQKELSQKLGIQPATITMMVRRMAKAGLIERRKDEDDLRISRVYLTDAGRETRDKVEVIISKLHRECFDGLDLAEQESLKALLMKVKANLLKETKGSEL